VTNRKILVVDDNKETCDALTEIFAGEGYQTFSALDGRSALDTVKKKKPELVLLDIKMPKMDGIEVLKRIKKIDKEVVVVMITGYGALDTAKEAMRLGAYDYVTKPLDVDFIKAVIRDALSKRKPKRVVKRT
jgi:DNA-binding NtrC family response regulator